jgi:hypothetical protein
MGYRLTIIWGCEAKKPDASSLQGRNKNAGGAPSRVVNSNLDACRITEKVDIVKVNRAKNASAAAMRTQNKGPTYAKCANVGHPQIHKQVQ